MSDHKKYVGKKRKKIFSIEKIYPKKTPKNLPKPKINLSLINHLFSPKTKIPKPSFKLNSNLDENQEKLSPENQRHSLIGISKEVFKHLKQVENTTGNEVTEHIKNVLQSKKNDQSNQKNIQRRVYDAINVMCAIGLIRKNKQEIQFLKNNKNEIDINSKNNNIKNINEKKDLNVERKEEEEPDFEEKFKEKTNELKEKRKTLIKLFLTLKLYEKYSELNDKNPKRQNSQGKIDFPFDLIIYDISSPLKIASKDDLSRYLFLSNSGFIHLTPYDIVKNLISTDIINELNEKNNSDYNSNQNKNNSKKSTNEESLLEDFNFNNINDVNESFNSNDYQEEQKIEEDPKKIKILKDSFNNYTCIIPKEKKNNFNFNINSCNEKFENIAFNYLSHLKAFRDELILNDFNQFKVNNQENNQNNENCKDEIEEKLEKEDNISFIENRFRKNSNISCNGYNIEEENNMKENNGDCMSELGLFN